MSTKNTKTTKKSTKNTTTKNTTTKNTKNTKKERPVYDLDIKVTRVFDGKYGVLFDMTVNHVCINGCRVVSTGEGEAFVGFPQKRDRKDEDKWWNIAYVPLSDDQTSDILDQVEDLLAGGDEDDEEDEEEDEEE